MATDERSVVLETVTKDEFLERVKSYRDNQGMLDLQKYGMEDKPYFLNKMVKYYSKNRKRETRPTSDILTQIEWVVEHVILPRLKQTGLYDCQSLPCGSVYEGTKVGVPNEFDFVLEANKSCLDPEKLHIKVTIPDTVHASSTTSEKSFFRIYFKDEAPACWQRLMKCNDCTTAGDCSEGHPGRYICSRAVQNDFTCTIQNILSAIPAKLKDAADSETNNSTGVRQVHVTRSGPAANVFLLCPLLPDPGIIKIDFTFSIPLQRVCPYSWPLATCDELNLHRDILNEYLGIDKCYLVPAGDYWRLSFVPHEKELMSRLASVTYKKYSIQALKRFRDELSITDDYEKSLLTSYPLKVSFLKENADKSLVWDKTHLADRAISILSRVEQEGKQGNLTSFYIPDDPILAGDTTAATFVETRRMVRSLEQYRSLYYLHGRMHVIFYLAFFVSQVASVVASSVVVVVDFNSTCAQPPFLVCDETFLSRESITMLVVSMTTLCWPLVGLLWIKSSQPSTHLYEIYRHIKRLYVAGFLVVLGQSALAVAVMTYRLRLLDTFQFIDNLESRSVDQLEYDLAFIYFRIRILAYISLCLSTAMCALLLLHVAVVCACGMESCKTYDYPKRSCCSRMYCCFEVVFFDGAYTRRCRKGQE